MTTAHDLIDDELLSVRSDDGVVTKTTLPGALAGLCAGSIGDFPHLRTHQLDAWMMFLSQLGAIALHHARKKAAPEDEKTWRKLLLALSEEAHEPWSLLIGDLKKPAFFQSPVPEREGVAKWARSPTPDSRDVLVTSKAHDLKPARVAPTDAEAWVYALCSLQTMQGYPGRGYNPISRMKSGFGNRPRVGLAPSLQLGPRLLRDLAVLLAEWDELIERGFSEEGVALVWVEPWNGKTSIPIGKLSPHFIEVCQRLRLVPGEAGLELAYSTSEKRRCLASTEDGDVGDAWIPIARDGGALTVGAGGFHYRTVVELLTAGAFEIPAAQRPRKDDAPRMQLIFSALARGQGKTEGLHERVLPLSEGVRRRLAVPDQRAALGERARRAVERAHLARSKVLFPALSALGHTQDSLDARVDRVFFDALFTTIDETDVAALASWDRQLVALAREELSHAIDRAPLGDARFYRATSEAERVFEALVRKHFPDVTTSPVQEVP